MSDSIQTAIEIAVECEGRYHRGAPAGFNPSFGNYLPGDPEEISDFKVYLVNYDIGPGGRPIPKRLDITQWISPEEYEELYKEFLENVREDS